MGVLGRFFRKNQGYFPPELQGRQVRLLSDRGQGDGEMDPEEIPYAHEFDLENDRELERLLATWKHEKRGGTFTVKKDMDHVAGIRTVQVRHLDRFPTEPELMEMVYDHYGGGTYHVYRGPHLCKTYQLDGPSTWNPEQRESKSSSRTIKQEADHIAGEEVRRALEDSPEVRGLLVAAWFKKNYGVSLPHQDGQSMEERLLEEELEKNPAYRQQYLEALLKKRGVRKQEEQDDMDRLIERFQKEQKLKRAMGLEENGGGLTGVLKEVAPILSDTMKAMAPQQLPQPALPSQATTAPQPVIQPQPPSITSPAPLGEPQQPEDLSGGVEVMPNPETDLNMDPEVDWMSLMMEADLGELERGTQGDPGRFMVEAYRRSLEYSKPHMMLFDLFAANPPQAITLALRKAGEQLNKGWVRAMATGMGKGADLDTARRILDRLTSNPQGQMWVAQGALAAKELQRREDSAATEEPSTGNPPMNDAEPWDEQL